MSILLMINSSKITGRDTLDTVRSVRLFWLYFRNIDLEIAWLDASATILGDVVSFVVDMQPSAWLQKTYFCLKAVHFKHSKRMP
jgi:hypothetical protein